MEKASKVSMNLRPTLWHAFRMACLQRKIPAGKEVERLIEQQLATWQQQPQKETDHG